MSTAYAVQKALEQRGFKQRGKEWRGPSPFRIDSDSDSFAVNFGDDNEHGSGYDHVTKVGYSLYQIAEELGIETPKNGNGATPTKRGYDGLGDYAKAHGVPAEVFGAAMWTETTYNGRKALAFPTASGKRWRLLDDPKQKFANEKGYKRCWYGLDRAIETATKYDYPLVICNGEPSVVVATHYGLPACCVTGGENSIPDALLLELKQKWSGQIIIALDCDDTGRAAATKIAAQLLDRQHAIADLQLDNHGDLADFCKLHGDTVTESLLVAAGDFNAPAQDVLTAAATLQLAEAAQGLKGELSKDKRLQNKQDLAMQIAAVRGICDSLEMESGQGKVKGAASVAEAAKARFLERRANPNKVIGLSSGIADVDKMINSFIGSRLYTILGATGMGKSTLTASFAGRLMHQSAGLVAATETQSIDWLDKLVAYVTGIAIDKIMEGNTDDKQTDKVVAAYDKIATTYINFVEIPQPTPAQIRSGVYQTQREYGACGWLVVDSASKCMAPGAVGIFERMNGVYDGLHAIAQDFDIPVIATSQVSRDLAARPEGKKRPMITDAYGGAAAENNSDVVWGLYRHDYYVKLGLEPHSDYLPDGSALLTTLKNRWKQGGDVACRLAFRGGCGYYAGDFREVSLDSRKVVAA